MPRLCESCTQLPATTPTSPDIYTNGLFINVPTGYEYCRGIYLYNGDVNNQMFTTFTTLDGDFSIAGRDFHGKFTIKYYLGYVVLEQTSEFAFNDYRY